VADAPTVIAVAARLTTWAIVVDSLPLKFVPPAKTALI
jgi:hypothetical protein